MVSARREHRVGPPGRRRTRELGQNFLVDPNILDVIERLAEVGPDDVVLEVGGGLGVLSPTRRGISTSWRWIGPLRPAYARSSAASRT